MSIVSISEVYPILRNKYFSQVHPLETGANGRWWRRRCEIVVIEFETLTDIVTVIACVIGFKTHADVVVIR